ncbi:conserved hypothetical protein [Sphingobium sp. SYK-6]|uniref:hypothetical protein n=1 Tax=Sphingobium sp. (strain NBRC 103272 / SYK-6) TaxID=627192 RepID=UPI0002277138|nr:hypothetical protein [Sphingobium sp. SYK-6]BAK66892.1 conserved hypothetical protein [Sphingobium sp. SYK-6]
MAKVHVHAGDWGKGAGQFTFGSFALPKGGWGGFEGIPASQLQSIEQATEEAVKRVGGTVGWGIVGATLLGPVGLLAGLLAGGRGKDVTFVAVFKDGRKFLGTTDSKAFVKMKAATF